MSDMHIIVCVKQVWDPEFPSVLFRIDETTGKVIPVPGLSQVVSPFDEQAVEAALRIRDAGASVKITILSFGPASAEDAVRAVLALGADEGVLVVDENVDRHDSFTTIAALSAAVKKLGRCDLILAGRQAADTDAGVVGCGIAETLGIPVITFAKDVQVRDGIIRAVRVLEDGLETVEAPLPSVVTVAHELGRPRYASLKETMRARRKPVTLWSAADLGLLGEKCDGSGARVRRERLFVPRRDEPCEFIQGGTPQQLVANLARRLQEEGLL